MPRNNRELSQFASFIEVTDNVKKLGIKTDLSITGGLGIGAGLSAYLSEIQSNGDDPQSLVVFKPSRFLKDVVFEGNVSIATTEENPVAITSQRITVPELFVTELLDVNAPSGVTIQGNIGIGTNTDRKSLTINNFTQVTGLTTFTNGAIFLAGSGSTVYAYERVVIANPQFQGNFNVENPVGFGPFTTVLEVEGGARIGKYLSVGLGLSVADYITIGSSATRQSEFISTSIFKGDLRISGPTVAFNAPVSTNFLSTAIGESKPTIGSTESRWEHAYLDKVSVRSSSSFIGTATFEAINGGVIQFSGNPVQFIDGFTSSNISTVGKLIVNLDQKTQGNAEFIGISTFNKTIEGIARTSLQANNADLYTANLDTFYFPTYSLSGTGNTVVGERLYVSNGFGFNPISSDAYIGGNLSVLGNAINADVGEPNLRFFLLNTPKSLNAFLSADEMTLGGQATSGVTTIRTGQTHVNILRVNQNTVRASTGNTNFIMDDNINTKFFGSLEFDGDTIKSNRGTAYIFDETVQYANLLGDAIHVDIGSNNIGITSLRNNRIDLYGNLLLKTNQILASDEAVSIVLDSNRKVTIQGDLLINGNDILASTGATNITLQNNLNTIFAGDIQVGGNEIRASDGNINIMMQSNTLTSIAGALRIEGNTIQAGTGATNITLVDGNQTVFAGDIRVNGNSIRAGNGLVNIEMEDNTKTIFQGDIQVNGDDIRASDGTICITLEAPSGNVAIGSDLYANSVYFSGNNATLNNHNVRIKDSLIDISLLEDPNNLGTLIGPNTSTDYDAGIILNYYNVGLNTSKKASVFWDNSVGRVAIATDVTEVNPNILTVNAYSELESKGLVINSTSGVRRLLEDDGTYLQLKRVVIDAGTY
jgi:hypothetical protein